MVSLEGAGASQIHKGIPHLHSEMPGEGDVLAVSGIELISNLEIESVTGFT